MVVPWVGVPMSSVITKLKPRATAKYVQFETYLNRKEMPGTRLPVLELALCRRPAHGRGDEP